MSVLVARFRSLPSVQITLSLALLVLGFLIAAQVTGEKPRTQYSTQERAPLIQTALDLQTRQDALKVNIIDLRKRIGDQLLHLVTVDIDEIGGVFGGEPLHRGQQQRLARQRSHARKARARNRFLTAHLARGRRFALVGIGALPDRLKRAVQAQARIDVTGKLIGCGDDRFERGAHVAIAMLLASRQRPSVTTKEGQMRG